MKPAAATTSEQPADILYEGKPTWKTEVGNTVIGVLTIPLLVGVFLLIRDAIRRASTKYRITTRRVEWETGFFSRRIDGVDLWRVKHVNYLQTVGDRFFGLSRIEIYSQDAEDPHLILVGLPAARDVYDGLTAAVQGARQGTVGLVQ